MKPMAELAELEFQEIAAKVRKENVNRNTVKSRLAEYLDVSEFLCK
jgi:hypothetical protein